MVAQFSFLFMCSASCCWVFPAWSVSLLSGATVRQIRRARFRKMAGDSVWSLIGYMGVLTGFLISGYYAVVSGWCLEYIWASLLGKLNGDPTFITNYFVTLLARSCQASVLDTDNPLGNLSDYRERREGRHRAGIQTADADLVYIAADYRGGLLYVAKCRQGY